MPKCNKKVPEPVVEGCGVQVSCVSRVQDTELQGMGSQSGDIRGWEVPRNRMIGVHWTVFRGCLRGLQGSRNGPKGAVSDDVLWVCMIGCDAAGPDASVRIANLSRKGSSTLQPDRKANH